tara:strand:- start:15917 stop:16234 length:318 start_codon:yes stop_codon:yes gene_type:complete
MSDLLKIGDFVRTISGRDGCIAGSNKGFSGVTYKVRHLDGKGYEIYTRNQLSLIKDKYVNSESTNETLPKPYAIGLTHKVTIKNQTLELTHKEIKELKTLLEVFE